MHPPLWRSWTRRWTCLARTLALPSGQLLTPKHTLRSYVAPSEHKSPSLRGRHGGKMAKDALLTSRLSALPKVPSYLACFF
jgi:hypothetical protein